MFKHIRSFVGKFFNENQQMIIVMYLSHFFWFLRKYFLAVEVIYPKEFLDNWSIIKNCSSQDRERNFTVYQMIKVHNEIFKGKETNIIEFGVDRGGTLTTISKFVKEKANKEFNTMFGPLKDKKKQLEMSKRVTDQMTRESKEALKEVKEGLKEIDIYMGMLQKKGRSVHQSGGLAHVLGV